jgi:hypothetical protein
MRSSHQSAIYAREAIMADRSEEARLRAEANFKKKQQRTDEGEKVWAEHLASGAATDANRAKLKAQRLARDAAEKPSTPKGARKEKPPTGTKGEEISSQGQLDEGSRRRTSPGGRAK